MDKYRMSTATIPHTGTQSCAGCIWNELCINTPVKKCNDYTPLEANYGDLREYMENSRMYADEYRNYIAEMSGSCL